MASSVVTKRFITVNIFMALNDDMKRERVGLLHVERACHMVWKATNLLETMFVRLADFDAHRRHETPAEFDYSRFLLVGLGER